jgi:hypothetical protein
MGKWLSSQACEPCGTVRSTRTRQGPLVGRHIDELTDRPWPETMVRWHRAGWKLFWRLKSRPGRPPIPRALRTLIRRMANPSWGQERITNELVLKLGIHVSREQYGSTCPIAHRSAARRLTVRRLLWTIGHGRRGPCVPSASERSLRFSYRAGRRKAPRCFESADLKDFPHYRDAE